MKIIKKSTLLAMVMAVLCLMGCTEQEPEKENGVSFGAYFYLDSDGIIHSDDKCEYVAMHHGAKPIYPKEIREVGYYSSWRCCSQCLNEEDYKFVQGKCQAHQNRIKISTILYNNGYYFYGSQDWIDTVDNDKDLKWVYDRMKEWGYDFGSSFVEFKEYVGVDNKKEEIVLKDTTSNKPSYIIYIIIGSIIIMALVLFIIYKGKKTRKCDSTNKKRPSTVNRDGDFENKKKTLEDNVKLFKADSKDLKLYKAALNSVHDILLFLDQEIAAMEYVDETVRKHIVAVCMIVVNEGFYIGNVTELSKRINEMPNCKDVSVIRLNTNYIMHQCWIGYNEKYRDYVTKCVAEAYRTGKITRNEIR